MFCLHAVDGFDFKPITDHLITFGEDQTSHAISIEIIDDNLFEELAEKFFISLSTNVSRLLLDPNETTIYVIDNDSKLIKYNNVWLNFIQCHVIVIIIGFENTTYQFEESDGTVTLTVSVLNGTFGDSVSINVSLTILDVSARGILISIILLSKY